MDLAAVAGAFELGRVVHASQGPVARGRQGQVWRLETTEGVWAVKVAFAAVDEAQVAGPAAFQERAHAAGVPTPEVRRTPAGTVLARVSGTSVRVHGWVHLGDPDPLVDPAAVGELVAAIHRLDEPVQGPADPWSHEAVGADRWDELVRELTSAGAPFAARLKGLRDELVALEGWIRPPRRLRTCHRDLWADNVLPTPDGGLCVIDWEESGPADPTMELAAVLFEFGRSDPGRARALVEAYGAAGGPASVTDRGDFTMLIAQLGHITATACADWLEPNLRSPTREVAQEWVEEVFEDPHTRSVLDSLLAAVTVPGTPAERRSPRPGRRG